MYKHLALFGLGILGGLGIVSMKPNYSNESSLEQKVESAVLEDTAHAKSQFEIDAERLNTINPDYNLTAEDLITLARVVYHEEGSIILGKSKGFSEEEVIRGYQAIASGIKNRFDWDNQYGTRQFHDEEALVSYVRKKGAIDSLRNYAENFTAESMRDSGQLTLGTSNFGQRSRAEAYKALVGVLAGEIEDPTNGALFWKTKKVGEEGVVWHNTEAFWRDRNTRCTIDWTTNVNKHQYYGVNCES